MRNRYLVNQQLIKKNKKIVNIGIELLRMILSFLIVVYHIYSRDKHDFILNFVLYFLSFYTPTFFLISFYFSFRSLSSKMVDVAKERILRIILPYLIWPIIIFLVKNIYILITLNQVKYSFRILFIQFIVGRKINDVFWFQFNLIFISIIILIIIFICSLKVSFFVFLFLTLSVVYFNYKGLDKDIFGSYNISIFHSIGRLSYSYIYSITGFFRGSFNLLIIIQKKYKLKVLLFSPILIYILKVHKKFYYLCPQINCLRIDILIVLIFIVFGSLPFDSIKSDNLIAFFKKITSFTGGVYYMHLFIYDILSTFLEVIRNRSINSCIIIYLICYSISLIFSNIFKTTKIKYLFI